MFRLTKQEQIVLCIVALILVTGLVVKAHRAARAAAPPAPAAMLAR
ncbi:MAG: hypothetical protein N2379_04940 [Verrucomicrobiae bacterium]|nr:hypothetical protein [Verrucomicrobiae bacterium]